MIEVKRKDFIETLGMIQHITERRTNQPILSHVLIKSDSKDIQFFVTDLEIFVRARSTISKGGKFETALPARELYELAKELESETIKFEITDGKVEIKAKEGKYQINVLSPSQFPLPKEKEYSYISTLPAKDLHELIDKTAFAASSDESRYVLTGVLVEIDSGYCRFVASDGHRLAFFEKQEETKQNISFILPKNGISDIKRMLTTYQKPFELYYEKDEVLLKSEDISLWIKTIQEDYPNWKDVIPSEKDIVSQSIVKTQEIKKSIKRASLFASQRFPYVVLTPQEGKLVVQAESEELGSMKEELDSDTSGEKDIKVALSIKYLLDAINSVDSPLISIKISGESSPTVVSPIGGVGATNVIMPIRI